MSWSIGSMLSQSKHSTLQPFLGKTRSMHGAVLRRHVGGKCWHDGPICAQPAAAAVAAGHCHQQRSQHARNGSPGALAVCRAHHSSLGPWHPAHHLWAAADQRICCQHSCAAISASSSRTSAPAASRRPQQPARPNSCQEAFVMLSQQRRQVAVQSFRTEAEAVTAAAAAVAVSEAAPVQGSDAGTSDSSSSSGDSNADVDGSPRGSSSNGSSSSSSNNSSNNSSSSSTVSGAFGARNSAVGKLSYRMIISYDGTVYSGWQLQAQARTIQAEIERALTTVLREDRETLAVCAAGRTDAGVHAVGQVVQFLTNVTSIDPERLPYKLNSLLPHDIRVSWMSQTARDFNVTHTAEHKTYHYHLDTGACHDPLRLRYSHHVRQTLDLDAMQAAAALMLGTHDFTQLSNDSPERLRRNPVKTLQRLDVVHAAPNHVRLEVQGTGFLYKQVRHMTGALLAVGQGKMAPDHIQRLLDIGNSQAPGAGGAWRGYNVAPAKGLQLFEVAYPAAVDDPTAVLYPEYQQLLLSSDSDQ